MRKLGNGQSVTFCVSPEMRKRIRRLGNLKDDRQLNVADIIVSSIRETWDDAHRSLPLWATLGIRHQQQEIVWDEVAKAGELSAEHVQEYLEDEAQSLEQRYRPFPEANGASDPQNLTSKLKEAEKLTSRQAQVSQIRAKCIEVGLANLDSTGALHEEQERELAPEIERERQIERPPPKQPASHSLHNDVVRFACSGVFNYLSTAPIKSGFMPAFEALANTNAGKLFPVKKFPSSLFVTVDFARTLHNTSSGLDAYQRPVQWVLTQSSPTAAHGMRMVIISPYEAEWIKPMLLEQKPRPDSKSGLVQLRAYLPRTSLSYGSMEDLTTYVYPDTDNSATPPPPAELVMQLNLFSGQLYLRGWEEYVRLTRYLGLLYRENEGDADVGPDGFVGKKSGNEEYQDCDFETSPIPFLSALIKRIRRDCLDIGKTHLGRLLGGEILRERDFDEAEFSVGSTALVEKVEQN
jgi:hypothetical protein